MTNTKTATAEEVWATIDALGKAQQRTEEARREGEKALREAQQRTEEARREGEKALREAQQRTEEAQQRTEEAQQRTEEAQQRTEEARREGEKALRDAQRRTEEALQNLAKDLEQANGNFNRKWGDFLEKFVRGDLVNLLRGHDINVTKAIAKYEYNIPEKNVRGEFDLIALDGDKVVVVEVKTSLTMVKLKAFLKKLKKFREHCSELAENRQVLGAVAYLDEYIELRDNKENEREKSPLTEAIKEGLFTIQTPGGESKVSIITNPKGFKPKVF